MYVLSTSGYIVEVYNLFVLSGVWEKMGIRNVVNMLLGLKPVNIGELNRRVTASKSPVQHNLNNSSSIDDIIITEQYRAITDILQANYPQANYPAVFVTGKAGTGKSTLIRYLRNVLNKRLVVLAPTGVAALNVEGVTIHSFFHFPPKIHEESDIKVVADRKLYKRLELIIIDEVSMVRCDLLDSIDKFLRKNRSSDIPFGGVQLLLVGDLFQLPPVIPKHEWEILSTKGYTSRYFFSSFSLQEMSLIPIELATVYRQEDQSFVNILNCIRIGEHLNSTIDIVNSRCYRQDNIGADITLTCTNKQADNTNRFELNKLQSKEFTFIGKIEGRFSLEHDKLPSPIELTLKVGARVMFTKNDYEQRWVNGTLGTVRSIDENTIKVQLDRDNNGDICYVSRVSWATYKYSYDSIEDKIIAEKVGQYTQYPLMLGWAVTIHKSQGKTLDKVLIDFGHGAFTSGQAYVALSRCRRIDGIQLTRPLRESDVQCDQLVKQFYFTLEDLQRLSNQRDS